MGWDAAAQVVLRAFGIGVSGWWVRDDAWAIRLAPCPTPQRLRKRGEGQDDDERLVHAGCLVRVDVEWRQPLSRWIHSSGAQKLGHG